MTPHDLIAWCLHSPKRFAVVLATVGVLGASGLVLLPDAEPVAGSQKGLRARAVTVTHSPPAEAPAAADPSRERPAEWPEVRAAAEAFMTSYLGSPRPGNRTRVQFALKDQVTPALWRGLRLTDPSSFPTGAIASLEPAAIGAFASELHVVLEDGQELDLILVEYQGDWRVADVQPGERAP